jgi:hypothetical protein
MNNIQIKTKVYTNRIVLHIREVFHKNIDTGVIADTIKQILSDDGMLDAIASCAWDEDDKQGVCAFTPEQLLELAPYGFNPYPINDFVLGHADLESAIHNCFSQTFSDVWAADSWAENGGGDIEELNYDLFEQTLPAGNKRDVWLATNKEGVALCDLCPKCREESNSDGNVIDLKAGTGKSREKVN